MVVVATGDRVQGQTSPPRSAPSSNAPALPERGHAQLEIALAPIAQRALVMLSAQGTAIALRNGDALACRAAAGESSPDVGVTVEARAGLTGECLRSGRVLACADTARDKRVHPSVAEAGIRGVLVAPLKRGDLVLGVVEAFSSAPHLFGARDEQMIAALADEITRLVPANHQAWRISSAPVKTSLAPPVASTATLAHASIRCEADAVPGFLDALSVSQPPKSRRRLWVAGAVLATVATGATITYTRQRESFVAPAPISESSVVNRQHLEAIKASAEQGNVGAQSVLALFYWTGRGVKQDNEAAYMWSAIAATNGDANSKERLQLLRAQMSPESVTRAEGAKTKWLREHADAQPR